MKKGIFILLILMPYIVFSETYYVIGNTIYKGDLNTLNNDYKVEVVSPENRLNEISDKRIILIKDGVKESIDQMYTKNGNISNNFENKRVDDNSNGLVYSGNILGKSKEKNKLYEKSHVFSYFMPKDYEYWNIGGRKEKVSYADLDAIGNTIWYRIHKEGYSEITLYKDFELPYNSKSFVDFYAEIAGLAVKSKILPENAYSVSGIIFSFLNEKKESVDKMAFVWSSSEYPFKEHLWINPMPLKDSNDFNLRFNVADIVGEKRIKYIRVIFWVYCSEQYKTLSADLWIRNVKIKVSKIQESEK